MIEYSRAVLAAAWVTLALATAPYAPVSAASADSGHRTPNQRIFIDPGTGKVIQPEPRRAREASPRSRSAKRRARDTQRRGARAWTTDDGVQMLTPAPGDAPKTRVVRCPDGSLHVGDARSQARAALCSAPHD